MRTAGDSFTYTVTDADGDEVTRTITIVADDVPVITVNYNPDVAATGGFVDEDGLDADGNDDDGETTTGTIVITQNGDTPATLEVGSASIATNSVAGTSVTASGSNGDLTITSNGDGTFDWSYTLTSVASTDPAANDGENVLDDVESCGLTVTDSDGSVVTDTLTIDVKDDTPTAADDGSAVSPNEVAAGGSLTIDALDNDILGADGVDLVAGVVLDGVNGGASQGTVTYDDVTGTFSTPRMPVRRVQTASITRLRMPTVIRRRRRFT